MMTSYLIHVEECVLDAHHKKSFHLIENRMNLYSGVGILVVHQFKFNQVKKVASRFLCHCCNS